MDLQSLHRSKIPYLALVPEPKSYDNVLRIHVGIQEQPFIITLVPHSELQLEPLFSNKSLDTLDEELNNLVSRRSLPSTCAASE
jgi:hypothetical protein